MARIKNANASNHDVKEAILSEEQNPEIAVKDDYAEEYTDDMQELDKDDEFMREKCRIIGANVRFQRKKRRFSIDNLADCIKLSSSYVGLLERGDRCPSLKCLLKLCELFDVTPDELLLEKTDKKQPLRLSESNQNNYYDAVISLLHGLSEDELEYTANLLKGLRRLSKKPDSPDDRPTVSYKTKKRKS